ncbi:MAG: hypothetical protein QOJ50_1051 [Cryptosporangiaceae bacterium]|nr:hypothetical protein [Cryptosporangiaceae bacterium]
MPASWLSIRVDLVSGRGRDFWPRPGRIFAAAPTHTFAALGREIDRAFARWDHSHLHLFTLDNGTELTTAEHWDGEPPDGARNDVTARLSRLRPGEQFAYVFDLGDDWTHLCTVGERPVDPLVWAGSAPASPVPYAGWGDLPDQYGLRWYGDDGQARAPKRPPRTVGDLPPILPEWGG